MPPGFDPVGWLFGLLRDAITGRTLEQAGVDGPMVTAGLPIERTGYQMRTLTLQRTDSDDDGTFGHLMVDGTVFHTLELPDRDNQPEISCIPRGRYQCNWEESPRLGRYTYRLVSVPGRSGILFHPANLGGDRSKGKQCEINGCIALGMSRGILLGQKAILESREAILLFEGLLRSDSFMLEVV